MGRIADYPRSQRIEDEQGVQIRLDCYCHDCRLWHRPGPRTPDGFSHELWEWYAKHVGHNFEFLSPSRRLPRRFKDWFWQKMGFAPWYVEYGENTNFKLAYAAATAMTITLASLASSPTWIAGRSSLAIDNSTARNIDSEITARVMVSGTAPTVDTEIRVYGVQALFPDTTVVWPDQASATNLGTDAAVAFTSAYTRDGGIKPLLGATAVSAALSVIYPIACLSTAQAWGKEPKRWCVYVAQNTGQTLNATQAAPVLTYTSSYMVDS